MRSVPGLILIIVLFISCKENKGNPIPATSVISDETLRRHIEVLSANDFLGRKPFTEGERKTLAYLESEIVKLGLNPGYGGSYMQDVPLVEITGQTSPTMELTGEKNLTLRLGDQFVAHTARPVDSIQVKESPMVFCGYGIVAPEYNWNDYEGLDMKGKTALILVNDPGLGSEDSTFFKGSTMTYYGRWTYKFEEAARQGAAAVLIIHEANMAGYPYAVVQGSSSGAALNLESIGYQPCDAQGWVALDAAKEIFSTAGLDLQTAMQSARKPGFKSIPLPYNVNLSIRNEIKKDISKNVIAMIPGSEHPDEYIIFTAHWDHLGVGAKVDGDSIYNGAVDNATGTSTLLAIAEAMMKDGPYKRSVVFLWVTAEEQGLLGSAYYAENPIFPPAKTVANINIDQMYAMGPMKDLSVMGFGQSELEDYAARHAQQQGRYLQPDQEPEKGYFFRSDHFNFAKIGIPALYAKGSAEHMEKGKDYITERMDDFRNTRYHQPADEYDADFDSRGIIQDATLFFNLVKELANSDAWPQWKAGSEFKSIREKQKG